MAVARLRTARRRQTGALRLVVFAVLVAVGATAFWTSLQYSEAHAAARSGFNEHKQVPKVADVDQQEVDTSKDDEGISGGGGGAADSGGGSSGDGKTDPSASLAAWTELTTLPKGSKGSGSSGDDGGSSDSSNGKSAREEGSEQPVAIDSGAVQPGPDDKFVTVELRVPKMPPTYNSWVLAEDMLLFHRRALQQQLEQTYVAMGVAAAAGRAFILPEFACFCQNGDVALPRCRRPGGEEVQFPVPCPEGEVLMPLERFHTPADNSAGMALKVLPHSTLNSLSLDTSKTLVLKPSATILWPSCTQPDLQAQCTFESGLEGGATQLMLPPSLNDTHLLPFLDQYDEQFAVWRLDLSDIGSHWHAFAGWDCAEPAQLFDKRLQGAAVPWPAPDGSGLQPMNLTSGRLYSQEPDMKDCPGGIALRRMQDVTVRA